MMRMYWIQTVRALCALFLLPLCAFSGDPQALKFIPNGNQWPSHISYSTRLSGGFLNISPGAFHYYFIDNTQLAHPLEILTNPDAGGNTINVHGVRVDFVGAGKASAFMPFGKSRQYYNFFLDDRPEHWASGVHAYEGVLYPELYTGVDLKVYSSGHNLKYDLIVAPGADPTLIRLFYQGAEELGIEHGDLVVTTTVGQMREKQPLAWQYIAGKKILVRCNFVLRGKEVTFSFPDGYDTCHELTIDPLLVFSTYSGSTADNWGSTATPGENGKLYSAGATREALGGKFPATSGSFQTTPGTLYDIGILKYDSTGANLLYATYLGGNGLESAHSLVMDYNEDLVVLGTTSSTNFATTPDAFDRTFNGGTPTTHVYEFSGSYDIFVARISPDGTVLKASSYIGGTDNDGVNYRSNLLTQNYGDELRGDIITDTDGNVYISSVTSSADFPTLNGFGGVYRGGLTDAIVLKLAPDLSGIVWSSFVGGGTDDAAYAIKFDSEKNIFIAGGTQSPDFPVTAGSFQPTFAGGVDGWIAKLAPDGSHIISATFMGTPGIDQIYFLDLNSGDEPHVFGQTNSGSAIPKIPSNVYHVDGASQFIQKFTNNLSELVMSTTFGSGRSTPDISPTAFLVNDCGNLYMSGWGGSDLNLAVGGWPTSTIGLPVSSDAVQTTTNGNDFYFIVLADDATEFLYATYLGGTNSRTHVDGGTSRFDKGGIVYHAVCAGCANNPTQGPVSDFPATAGAWSTTNRSPNCNNAAFKLDFATLRAIIELDRGFASAPGVVSICDGYRMTFENAGEGGETFVWDFGDGGEPIASTIEQIQHEYGAPGDYVVRLKVIDEGTCRKVDSTQIIVRVVEHQMLVQDDDLFCAEMPYTLSASGAVSYEWRTEVGGVFSNASSPVVIPLDTTEYFVRMIDSNGCVHFDSVTLSAIPTIDPKFRLERIPSCSDRPVIRLINETDSAGMADNIFFDLGDGTVSDEPVVEHYFNKDSVYRISLIANREFCVYENFLDVPVAEYFVPNVITPEGSPAYNDYFTIEYFGRGSGKTPGDYGFRVMFIVYNRWGEVVYYSSDYQYDWKGEGLAAGVYYYEVDIEGHGACRSWLHLVK